MILPHTKFNPFFGQAGCEPRRPFPALVAASGAMTTGRGFRGHHEAVKWQLTGLLYLVINAGGTIGEDGGRRDLDGGKQ
jgi:hypothetical protein